VQAGEVCIDGNWGMVFSIRVVYVVYGGKTC